MQEPCSQVVGAEIADNNDYMATTIKNTILFFTDQEIILFTVDHCHTNYISKLAIN